MRAAKYVLDIEWEEGVDLPTLVGPFDTRDEAEEWDVQCVPNGTSTLRELAWPYLEPK